MARPSDLGDVGVNPEDVLRYKAIINPPQPMPAPPPADHPMVQYAQKVLAPLTNYTDTTPRESGHTGNVVVPPIPGYGQGPLINSLSRPAQQQGFTTPGNQYESGNFAYDAPIAGLLGRVSDVVAGPKGFMPADISNPLNAYGVSGNLAGYAPEIGAVAGAAIKGVGTQAERIAQQAGRAVPEAGFLRGESGYAQLPDKGPLTQRFEANAAGKAATEAPGATTNEALAAAAGEPVAPGTGGALKPGSTLAERQLAAMRATGASEEAIAAFQKTMAPELPKARGSVTSAEGQKIDAGLLTRSLQTAAGTEGVPLSQHPDFAAYSSNGLLGPKAGQGHGGDIGTATRAVMSGDPKVMELLGPDLTQQLIQNKIAQLVRQTGAPEDVIRKGLSVMGPDAAHAAPTQVEVVGKNIVAVEDALGVPRQKPGFAKTAEDRIRESTVPGAPPAAPPVPPAGPRPPSGSFMPADTPLPEIPNQRSAADWAKNVAAELFALPRALKAGLDLSAVLLQGSILLAKDVTKLPFYAYTAARGGAQRPYFQSALAQMSRAVISGESRVAQITTGFRDALEAEGFHTSGALKNIHIAEPTANFGNLAAREEYMVGDLVTKIPVIGLLYRQANFGYATLLNALRTGEALNLVRASKEVGIPVNTSKIGHFVNITTGYGDLPLQDTDASRKVATALSNVFFGPRLQGATIQNVTDNITAVSGIAGRAFRKPLDPTDIARIHATTAFVAAGLGAMKIAESSGMKIGTDPTGTDFGRIILPSGWRVDLWGPFNEYARLIAREIEFVRRSVAGDPPGYGEKNGIEELTNFVRGKLNPPAGIVADLIAGKTSANVPTRDAYTSTDPNVNPLIPAPFSVGTAASGAGPGLTVAAAFGAGVMPPSQFTKFDGLGRPESNAQFGKDIVFDEYTRLFPGKQLEPPDSTLGSGKNTFALPATEREIYLRTVGDQRRITIGELVYSQEYQNATKAQQEKMFKAAQSEADSIANRAYLKKSVITATDPDAIRAEAVTGFHAQPSNKDQAYWIAALDKAGKLTADVKQAIDDSNVSLPGAAQPIKVAEYLQAAPLVHEYLAHAPYGTDSHPLGNAEDWAAVDAAKKQTSVERDRLVRAGTNPSIADTQAKVTALKSLTSAIQRNLYLNGPSLVNPQRQLLAKKYGTMLTRFLGPGADITQESASQYP